MIEEVVISHLNSVLDVPVSGQVPAAMPASFVTVERTGSYNENHLDTYTLAVQSWAPTQYAAAALNKSVRTAMQGLLSLGSIARVKLSSDYDFTDASTKHNRYQGVYEVVYYEED